MEAGNATWEGIALDHHNAVGLDDPPVSALEHAVSLGLTIRLSGRHPCLIGRNLYLPRRMDLSAPRTHGTVAHEVGHHLLQNAGEDDTEDGARYLSGAIMLPRRSFRLDVSRMSWSLPELLKKHSNSSAEMVAYRICQTHEAVATIYDQGAQTRRIVSPALASQFGRRASSWERDLVERCYETDMPVQGDDYVCAWPVFNGTHRRVVLIAEGEQLARAC